MFSLGAPSSSLPQNKLHHLHKPTNFSDIGLTMAEEQKIPPWIQGFVFSSCFSSLSVDWQNIIPVSFPLFWFLCVSDHLPLLSSLRWTRIRFIWWIYLQLFFPTEFQAKLPTFPVQRLQLCQCLMFGSWERAGFAQLSEFPESFGHYGLIKGINPQPKILESSSVPLPIKTGSGRSWLWPVQANKELHDFFNG